MKLGLLVAHQIESTGGRAGHNHKHYHFLEAENGDQWQQLTMNDLSRVTIGDWPAYAGLLARMKPIEGGELDGENCILPLSTLWTNDRG